MGEDTRTDKIVQPELTTISKPKTPKMYRVVLHNDNYTTMDFVVEILVTIFNRPAAEATKIMLDVHKKGKGTCGVYTYDIALTKIKRVHEQAKQANFPLRCSYEAI